MTTQPLVDPQAVDPEAREQDAGALARRIVTNVEQVVHGRTHAVELITCALLAGGHALVEDVPGSGKTTMARAFARSLGGSFYRIQATADLLPADITGSGVWHPDSHAFRFVPGPLCANVVLVDELNRTPPRTQSAFMEAMDEGAVTVDGLRHQLPDPFFVVATQNPVEQYGTYPLPEGQLDRFAVRLQLGHLATGAELQVLREQLVRATVDDLEPVAGPEELRRARVAVRLTHVTDALLEHVLTLVRATREHPATVQGASSRAALTLIRCAQARALLAGRDYVAPDDIRSIAVPVLAHRLVLVDGATGGGRGERLVTERLVTEQHVTEQRVAEQVVAELVARLPVPLHR